MKKERHIQTTLLWLVPSKPSLPSKNIWGHMIYFSQANIAVSSFLLKSRWACLFLLFYVLVILHSSSFAASVQQVGSCEEVSKTINLTLSVKLMMNAPTLVAKETTGMILVHMRTDKNRKTEMSHSQVSFSNPERNPIFSQNSLDLNVEISKNPTITTIKIPQLDKPVKIMCYYSDGSEIPEESRNKITKIRERIAAASDND